MGLKRNLAYNSLLTLSQYFIGFITFPYVSRVLGASGIGMVSFVDNTINYFLLFSSLGISIIGTRETARFRNDVEKLNSLFSSLMVIYIITTVIIITAYFVAVSQIDKLHTYKELFYIGAAKIIFSVFLIEWFYKGIENFRFIAVRSIIIKLFYLVFLFVLVKDPGDYHVYFALTAGVVALNAAVNFIYAKKLTRISLRSIQFRPYIKSFITLGSYAILTSMYTTFNVIYLGWVSNPSEVGYYWAALTIYTIVLGFFTAFTTVMMPRMSAFMAEGNTAGFNSMIHKSFNTLFSISFPIIIIALMLAPQIIQALSGSDFAGAVVPMQLIMPLVIVVGIAQVLAVQVLMPLKKDRIILTASMIGSFIGIVLNILLVKKYGSVGTALVLLVSELSITAIYIYIMKRDNLLAFPWKSLLKNFALALPYAPICLISVIVFERTWMVLSFALSLSVLYFIYTNIYIIRNEEFVRMLSIVYKYLNTSLRHAR